MLQLILHNSSSNSWSQLGTNVILGGEYYGTSGKSVSVSSDGNIVAIGNLYENSYYGGVSVCSLQ